MENKIKDRNAWDWIGVSLLVLSLFIFGLGACTYDIKEIVPVEIPDSVSFEDNIIPFFTDNCAKSGCHATGGLPPDLSSANAYVSLTVFGYVETDTSKADQSIIYQKITAGSMSKYVPDPNLAELLLRWIKQGAKNN